MIEDTYKFISIDIPRTGSSARARLFAGMPEQKFPGQLVHEKYWTKIDKHAPATTYFKHNPFKYATYFKFTFVRNPWDRMASFFRYRQRKFDVIILRPISGKTHSMI